MPSVSQIKDGIFQVVAIFFAIAIAYVCVSDDGLNQKSVVLSPQFKANNTALCIPAKRFNVSAIKLLFCTRDVEVVFSTYAHVIDPKDFENKATDPVKILKNLDDQDGEGEQKVKFFKAADSFARMWHFTDRTWSVNQNNQTTKMYQSKTVHLSPFISVCFLPCSGPCADVTSTLVFNSFFTCVFFACLFFALILRTVAHRYWMLLSTTVITVALPCIVIFFIANRKASATWAGILAFGGWGFIFHKGKTYVWDFVKTPVGQAVIVVYIAAIIAANHFLPKPRYSQKSAVAWLGRIVCAAIVLVVSPQHSIPNHELQTGIPESSQIPSGVVLALTLLFLCIVFDSFSFGADVLPDDAEDDGAQPPLARTSAIKSEQPHASKHDRARSPQLQGRDSFASPPPSSSDQPFRDPQMNKMFKMYLAEPEAWNHIISPENVERFERLRRVRLQQAAAGVDASD